MPDAHRLSDWVDRYVAAWNSNDPSKIGALFTEHARYFTLPTREPWVGRDEIVREWLGRKDEPGDTNFTYEVLTENDEIGIVRGETEYISERTRFANLWEVRLDASGACREFVEWWIEHPGRPQG